MDQRSAISYSLIPTRQEIIAALRWRTWRSCRRVVIVLILGELVWGFGLVAFHTATFFWGTIGIAGFAVLWVLTVEMSIRKQATRQLKGAQTTGETTYTFSDTGFDTKSSVSSSHTAWGQVEKAEENDQFIFLHFPNNFALFVPHRRLTDEQWTALKTLIRNKLGAAAKLR